MSDHDHAPALRDEQIWLAKGSTWRKLSGIFLLVGIAGLGAAFGLRSGLQGQDLQRFSFSYLTAFMYFLALGLGALFFVLVQHASRAGWSIVVRRIAENLTLFLPVMALLSIPVFTGVHDLFHWSHAEAVANDPMLKAKAGYLNEPFFFKRAGTYLAIWVAFALMYYGWSTKQDTAGDAEVERLSHKMRWLSPLGLIMFATTLTFAAVDWLMSLDPHWFSTIFGVYYFAGAVVSIHALIALIVLLLQGSGYLRGVVTPEHYHDLGKMMFAFTVFWGYIGFSQYMLIWYASIPEETYWYAYRGQGQWLALSLLLVFSRFVIPFVLLLSRKMKRNSKTLAFWCVWILTSEYIDMFWLVQPVWANEHEVHTIPFGATDFLIWLGMAGLCLSAFVWGLGRKALVPVKDPRLAESLHFVNV